MAAGLVMLGGLSAHASDLASMQPPEIDALQKRLTDDGCCEGLIDGEDYRLLLPSRR